MRFCNAPFPIQGRLARGSPDMPVEQAHAYAAQVREHRWRLGKNALGSDGVADAVFEPGSGRKDREAEEQSDVELAGPRHAVVRPARGEPRQSSSTAASSSEILVFPMPRAESRSEACWC